MEEFLNHIVFLWQLPILRVVEKFHFYISKYVWSIKNEWIASPLFLVSVDVCEDMTVDSSELSSLLIHRKLNTLYHFWDTVSGSKSAKLTCAQPCKEK